MPSFSSTGEGGLFEDQTVQGGLVIKNQLATGVLLEDLDADGDLDLVVAFNGSGLRWWENNGRGQFGEMTLENSSISNRTDQSCGGGCGSERSSGPLCCQLRRKYHPQWSIGAHLHGKRGEVSSPEGGGTALKSSMASWQEFGNPITSGYSLPKARLFNCHGPKGVFWIPAGDL